MVEEGKSGNAVNGLTENHGQILNNIMLELTVEVGRTKIKISELMNLSQGSLLELEQHPEDPLVIYANDKPIAKGQIISSNGKYNIRIL